MAEKRGKIAHFSHFVQLKILWLLRAIAALTQVTFKSRKKHSGFFDIP